MEDFGFKFTIGQRLIHVGGDPIVVNGKPAPWGQARDGSWCLIVVSRLLEECPGGIQRHYRCRSVSADGAFTTDYLQLNEIELMPFEWPKESAD